jgi:hypothetical protein
VWLAQGGTQWALTFLCRCVQRESYLFCAEKNVWRKRTFRVYSYLRCSFLLFQELRIKQQLFYGPSFHVSVAVKCNTGPSAPGRSPLARQSQTDPARALRPMPPLGPTSPCPAYFSVTSHPEKHLEVLGPPAIKARRPPSWEAQWAAGSTSPLPPPAQPPAMPRTTAIVPWASPRALSHRWRDGHPFHSVSRGLSASLGLLWHSLLLRRKHQFPRS